MIHRLAPFALAMMLATPATVAVAQNPDPARAQQLRLQLEQRFAERLRTELSLTSDQETKVRAIMDNYARQRRELEQNERRNHQALAAQLRPGVAADDDSVTYLVGIISESRIRYAKLFQEELKELSGVLSPVQLGQLFMMRDQLLMRAQELRSQRMGGMGGRPGGPPPMFE